MTSKPVMTREQFQTMPEFMAASEKCRLWLLTFIENGGDYIHATLTAFDSKDARQAQRFSYAIRHWSVIRAALAVYFGRSKQDMFLEDLEHTIRVAPKGSDRQVRAQAIYARLKFGVGDEPKGASAEPKKPAAPLDPRIPSDALKVLHKDGVVVGFRNAQGEAVRLS